MAKAALRELRSVLENSAPRTSVAPTATTDPAPRKPTARRGRTGVTTYLTEEAHRQLRILALDERRSGQQLMVEAVNALFEKYGRPQIAD